MFNLELPINSMSMGQQGFSILVEIFNRKLLPNIFPIGNVDLSAFDIPNGMADWLSFCIQKACKSYKSDQKTIRLWHIQGSERTLTHKTSIWSPHETDTLTSEELNILSKHDRVFAQSLYSKEVFEKKGLKNVVYCPLYCYNWFYETNKKYVGNEKITTFGLVGKMEKRKNTLAILGTWCELFANKEEFRLIAQVSNPFLKPEQQNAIINQFFQGQIPWNVNFIPFQQRNSALNDVYNSIDIDLSGLSGAEGWGMPVFTQLCLGKQAVVLNAHSHKDFANESNSILVEPDQKIPIYDNQFFHQGAPFNQGNMFSFQKEKVQEALKEVVKVAKIKNEEGKKLNNIFTISKTVDILLE